MPTCGRPMDEWAKEYGYEPVVFEITDQVGGMWNFKPEETELGSVMKTTVINTSKEMTAYSDFPPPAEFGNFMHNRQLKKYFDMYTDHHDLRKHIRFNHTVRNVERADDYEETGQWTVEYEDNHSEIHKETFDCALICTGHHATPNMPPKWPGQDKFKGRILHAHSYKEPKGYEDSVVCVVGMGNSALDIAVEQSKVAKQTYLSTRRGAWVFFKNEEWGAPFDTLINRRWFVYQKNIIPRNLFISMVHRHLNQRFDHEKFGIKPAHNIAAQHPTINDDLPNRIMSALVTVKPNVTRFTEHGVVFEDGTVAEKVDHVIMCTGYLIGFPVLEGGKLLEIEQNNVKNMYKYIWPADLQHNTLGIIGMVQPWGSVMPIGEMQARLFFNALVGKTKLPSRKQMLKDIEAKRLEIQNRYVASPRHTVQVDYIEYMDELAEMVGCAVYPSHYIFRNPKFAMKLIFGPHLPYVYRLRGPNAWEGAKKAIETVQERIEACTYTRKCPTAVVAKKKGSFSLLTAKVASVVGAAVALWWAYPAVNAFMLQFILHERK
ncbi:CRE-FMO-1 protein [Aphelenchoides avenae]|nr:CRE-FMO-1 protein [Aphelenchus avenae]